MIICCGEALIDMLPRSFTDGSGGFLPVAGGAMLNTSIALARLGEESGLFTGLSTDLFGRQLLSHLEQAGVNTACCIPRDNPTTLAFVTLDKGVASYAFFDENSAGRMLSVDSIPLLPENTLALHFGGISLIQEPCGSVYEDFSMHAKETLTISFDPNIRPGFVMQESSYRARLQRMFAISDMIKISEEDLAWLDPNASFEQLANHWIEAGASIVTLTMGAKGARSITPRYDVEIAATPVTVVDTVGAGDTFNAAFLAFLRRAGFLSKQEIKHIDQATLQTAIRNACAAATYSVTQAGATPPSKQDLITAGLDADH